MQLAGKISSARTIYEEIVAETEGDEGAARWRAKNIKLLYLNLGAALQESGIFDRAIEYYKRIIEMDPTDDRAWNNYGASVWQLGMAEEAMKAFARAIELAPDQAEPYVNAGVGFYEYGDLRVAKEYYTKAIKLQHGEEDALHVRIATMIPPVMLSKVGIRESRSTFWRSVTALQNRSALVIAEPVKGVERLHFYNVYHGLDELPNQALMANLYLSSSPVLRFVGVSSRPESLLLPSQNESRRKRIRVGWISKFFTVNHAHGQLLEGIISGLPRSDFEVIVCAIPNPGAPLLQSIRESADELIILPFSLRESRDILSSLSLDILVFADTMSEPLTYFLALGSRVAHVQCAFWGNPLTTGSGNIDYFISGEHLEPRNGYLQYAEQVVLLRGQGIWYKKLVPHRHIMSRAEEARR